MRNETEEARQRRLANLKLFSSTHQPKNRKSRKGVPNRSTIFRCYWNVLEEEEEELRRKRRERRAENQRKRRAKKRQVKRQVTR